MLPAATATAAKTAVIFPNFFQNGLDICCHLVSFSYVILSIFHNLSSIFGYLPGPGLPGLPLGTGPGFGPGLWNACPGLTCPGFSPGLWNACPGLPCPGFAPGLWNAGPGLPCPGFGPGLWNAGPGLPAPGLAPGLLNFGPGLSCFGRLIPGPGFTCPGFGAVLCIPGLGSGPRLGPGFGAA